MIPSSPEIEIIQGYRKRIGGYGRREERRERGLLKITEKTGKTGDAERQAEIPANDTTG